LNGGHSRFLDGKLWDSIPISSDQRCHSPFTLCTFFRRLSSDGKIHLSNLEPVTQKHRGDADLPAITGKLDRYDPLGWSHSDIAYSMDVNAERDGVRAD
jgi:hypothetical protein